MLTIRLSRFGRKNQPTYRIVVQEKRRAPSSTTIEVLGHYDPRGEHAALDVKADRVRYWISHGAQLSNTLHNLFVDKKVIEGTKRRFVTVKKKQEEEQPQTPNSAAAPSAASEPAPKGPSEPKKSDTESAPQAS